MPWLTLPCSPVHPASGPVRLRYREDGIGTAGAAPARRLGRARLSLGRGAGGAGPGAPHRRARPRRLRRLRSPARAGRLSGRLPPAHGRGDLGRAGHARSGGGRAVGPQRWRGRGGLGRHPRSPARPRARARGGSLPPRQGGLGPVLRGRPSRIRSASARRCWRRWRATTARAGARCWRGAGGRGSGIIEAGRQRGGDLYQGRLGEVLAPTLLLHGRHDPRTEPGELEALQRALPQARLLLVEAGHCPHASQRAGQRPSRPRRASSTRRGQRGRCADGWGRRRPRRFAERILDRGAGRLRLERAPQRREAPERPARRLVIERRLHHALDLARDRRAVRLVGDGLLRRAEVHRRVEDDLPGGRQRQEGERQAAGSSR